jgi:ribA/ribD-fused uncharacterized protein
MNTNRIHLIYKIIPELLSSNLVNKSTKGKRIVYKAESPATLSALSKKQIENVNLALPALLDAFHNKDKKPNDWNEIKLSVMEEILRAKLEQHEDVKDALKRTEGREIIENSPVDIFWGIGPNKDGQNMLGNIWMKIRGSI